MDGIFDSDVDGLAYTTATQSIIVNAQVRFTRALRNRFLFIGDIEFSALEGQTDDFAFRCYLNTIDDVCVCDMAHLSQASDEDCMPRKAITVIA